MNCSRGPWCNNPDPLEDKAQRLRLSTPPRDDALALWLTFGSADTWCRDLHPAGFVPGTAHTVDVKG